MMLRKLIKPLLFPHIRQHTSIPHADFLGRKYLQKALENYEDIRFMPFRLRDWQLRESFIKAHIDVVQYLRDERGVREPFTVTKDDFITGLVKTHVVPFSSIFYGGFDTLRKNLGGRTDLAHVDLAANAFVTGFLNDQDYHELCLQSVLDNDQPNEVSVVLANHLLSRLTVSQGMTYCVSKDTKDKWHECPCTLRCGEKSIYGNTSFGSEHLWYGKPDIMLFPMGGVSCVIVVPKSCGDDEDISQQEELVFKISKEESNILKGCVQSLREYDNVQQITALTITFSMLQKRKQMKSNSHISSNDYLIPVITTDGEFFDIYMYSAENDILLRNTGNPIPLWIESFEDPSFPKLNMSSILQLWMIINHSSIRPSLNEDDMKMLTDTCGFMSKLSPDLLNKIEGTIKTKTKFRTFKEPEFDFDMLKLTQSKVLPS